MFKVYWNNRMISKMQKKWHKLKKKRLYKKMKRKNLSNLIGKIKFKQWKTQKIYREVYYQIK